VLVGLPILGSLAFMAYDIVGTACIVLGITVIFSRRQGVIVVYLVCEVIFFALFMCLIFNLIIQDEMIAIHDSEEPEFNQSRLKEFVIFSLARVALFLSQMLIAVNRRRPNIEENIQAERTEDIINENRKKLMDRREKDHDERRKLETLDMHQSFKENKCIDQTIQRRATITQQRLARQPSQNNDIPAR
jgi:hypothetical protein